MNENPAVGKATNGSLCTIPVGWDSGDVSSFLPSQDFLLTLFHIHFLLPLGGGPIKPIGQTWKPNTEE